MRVGTLQREGSALVDVVWRAERWWSRLRGLLGRRPLCGNASQGLLITPCGSIHTCGMRYRIDAVFLDRAGQVLSCHEAIPPFRFRMQRGAHSVLELAEGGVAIHGIGEGDRLSWVARPTGTRP